MVRLDYQPRLHFHSHGKNNRACLASCTSASHSNRIEIPFREGRSLPCNIIGMGIYDRSSSFVIELYLVVLDVASRRTIVQPSIDSAIDSNGVMHSADSSTKAAGSRH